MVLERKALPCFRKNAGTTRSISMPWFIWTESLNGCIRYGMCSGVPHNSKIPSPNFFFPFGLFSPTRSAENDDLRLMRAYQSSHFCTEMRKKKRRWMTLSMIASARKLSLKRWSARQPGRSAGFCGISRYRRYQNPKWAGPRT